MGGAAEGVRGREAGGDAGAGRARGLARGLAGGRRGAPYDICWTPVYENAERMLVMGRSA